MTVLKDKKTGCFADQDCTIKIKNKEFTAGGAFLGLDKNGKMGGHVYGDYNYQYVTNWDSSIKIPTQYYGSHYGNMGDKRVFVRFSYNGRKFFGRWCGMEFNQLINIRELNNS